MNHRDGDGHMLDLRLNLSPPRAVPVNPALSVTAAAAAAAAEESLSQSSGATSPPSSCLSSELNQEEYSSSAVRYSTSPEATSMVLAGCHRCLMYVMVSEDDTKCPRCKNKVFLDFLSENINNNKKNKSKTRHS